VYHPSRFLAGTDDEGPLGQLALIAPAERGSRQGIVGISATTGEYRFLDLPRWVEGSKVSLAPDGKHVAYWTTGHTTGTPYADPMLGGDGEKKAIAGVAIYDTLTGRVQQTMLSTRHGMSDEDLYWRDSKTVYFGDWQLENTHAAGRARFLSVTVDGPGPVGITDEQASLMDGHRNADGSTLVSRRNGLTWDVQGGPVGPGVDSGPTTVRLPATLPEKHSTGDQPNYDYAALAGSRIVVGVDVTPSLSQPLLVGDVDARGEISGLALVGDRFQDAQVLGWHDDHTLLAYGRDRRGGIIAAIDVSSGGLSALERTEGWGTDIDPAIDVLRGDLVHGLKPPNPIDPRLRNAGFLAGALVLAGAVLWVVRRRRRA